MHDGEVGKVGWGKPSLVAGESLFWMRLAVGWLLWASRNVDRRRATPPAEGDQGWT